MVLEDAAHPANVGLPARWERTDEWYNYTGTPRSCAHILATVDESTYHGGMVGKGLGVERVERLGGLFSIESKPGAGTILADIDRFGKQ